MNTDPSTTLLAGTAPADNLIAWVVERRTPHGSHEPGQLLVFVACPICGGRHQHGTTRDAYDLDDMGDRAAHCHIPGYSGYVLRRAPEWFANEFTKHRQCAAITAKGTQCGNKPADLGAPLCLRHLRCRNTYSYLAGPFFQGVAFDGQEDAR